MAQAPEGTSSAKRDTRDIVRLVLLGVLLDRLSIVLAKRRKSRT